MNENFVTEAGLLLLPQRKMTIMNKDLDFKGEIVDGLL